MSKPRKVYGNYYKRNGGWTVELIDGDGRVVTSCQAVDRAEAIRKVGELLLEHLRDELE